MPIIQRPESGLYVCFEGIEGSGKSHYARRLEEKYRDRIYVAEEFPDDGICQDIMETLKKDGSPVLLSQGNALREFSLFVAMKEHLFQEKIVPALKQDRIVIENRGPYTNCIYQAVLYTEELGGSPLQHYRDLMKIREQSSPKPDKVVLFTPNFDRALRRAQDRDGIEYPDFEINRIRKVYELYLEVARLERERFIFVKPDERTTDRNVIPSKEATEDVISELEIALELAA